MSDLLDLALAAHGGWDYWQHLSKLTAYASVGGVLWALKGKDGILDCLHLIGSTQRLYAKPNHN